MSSGLQIIKGLSLVVSSGASILARESLVLTYSLASHVTDFRNNIRFQDNNQFTSSSTAATAATL